MILGIYLCAFSLLFVGPAQFLPNNLLLMAVGQGLQGFFQPLLVCYNLPEMNRLVDLWHGDLSEASRSKLYDFNCGFWVSLLSAG